jgi:hypothetical protein
MVSNTSPVSRAQNENRHHADGGDRGHSYCKERMEEVTGVEETES